MSSPSPDAPRSQVVARQLKSRLLAAFQGAGWHADLQSSGTDERFRPDMLVRRGTHRYAVELKVAREPRRALIQAMFADAVLQARVHALEHHASPLAVVAAAQISPPLAQDIHEYARRFASDVAWGLLDSGARFELHGRGLDEIRAEPVKDAERASPLSRPPPDVFSDLNQWMLKVFIAERIDPKYLGSPRRHIRNASSLAALASVSLPSASRLVGQLRRLRFAESDRHSLRLVRVADLMQSWREAGSDIPHEIGARWLVPTKDGAAQLGRTLAAHAGPRLTMPSAPGVEHDGPASWREGPRACLGLFAASEKLGFRFAHGAPLHLYVEDISVRTLVERFGLTPTREGEQADVIVRQPRFPEAVFRACVVRDGIPAADIIQCWIDISNHPARGREHAEQIWRRVLAPRLGLERDS